MMDDRGVSDLVAFVLIFGVMIASVGAIAVVGWDVIGEVRDTEQMDSAQAAFVTFNDQLNGIADHEAPARATEMRLGEATLAITDGPQISVETWENETVNATVGGTLGAVQFQRDDRHVTAAGGAVFRGDEDGSVMVSEPPLHCYGESARVNLISLTADDVALVDSAATVQVQSRHLLTQMRVPSTWSLRETARNVTVTVEDSPNQAAWERYLVESGWEATGEEGAYICEAAEPPMQIIVRTTRIGLEFIR